MRAPLEGNQNHFGVMYAGVLFSLGELPGGIIYLSTFDTSRFYPLVKEVNIRFTAPTPTDATVEVRISESDHGPYQGQQPSFLRGRDHR